MIAEIGRGGLGKVAGVEILRLEALPSPFVLDHTLGEAASQGHSSAGMC
jgi:hypothetical protein